MEKPFKIGKGSLSVTDLSGVVLLAALIFCIFILPALPPGWQARSSRVVYTIIYFSAIFSLEKPPRFILVISILAFCMEWIAGLFSMWILATVSKTLDALFFLIVVVALIYQVATSKKVSLEVILGSIIGYLMLGLVYSITVAFIIQQDPVAFNIPHQANEIPMRVSHLGESIYFSFISLATVGYGDIVPLKPYARSLAIWIGVSGQLYIAIIIALLVGKFASGNKEEK